MIGFGLGFSYSTGATAAAAIIGGLAATSFAATGVTPNIQVHAPTANMTFVGGQWAGTGTISGGVLTVVSTTSGALAIGMILTVPGGPYLQQDSVRIKSGSGSTWTLTSTVTGASYATETAMVADGTKVIMAINDVNGDPLLTAASAISAPLLHTDGFGRKWVRHCQCDLKMTYLTATTAGMENTNVTWIMVARCHGGNDTHNQMVMHGSAATPTAVFETATQSYSNLSASSVSMGAPYPYMLGRGDCGPRTASQAIRDRLIVGAQPQVIGVSSVDTNGYGNASNSVTSVRVGVNEGAFTPTSAARTKTQDTGFVVGCKQNGQTGNFDWSELVGFTSGQMGTVAQAAQTTRFDACMAAVVANWKIPPVVDTVVTGADSRWDYNFESGYRPALILSEPGGPYRLPETTRVIDCSIAGGMTSDMARFINSPTGIIQSIQSGKRLFVPGTGHNDNSTNWPFTTTTQRTAARADETFNGNCTSTFDFSISGSVMTISNYAGSYPLVAKMPLNHANLPAGVSVTSLGTSTGGNGTVNVNVSLTASGTGATADWPTFVRNAAAVQGFGWSVLGVANIDPPLTGLDTFYAHIMNDMSALMPNPSKFMAFDSRQIKVGANYPLGANFANGNGYILPDSTHMTDAGTLLDVAGGDSGIGLANRIAAALAL